MQVFLYFDATSQQEEYRIVADKTVILNKEQEPYDITISAEDLKRKKINELYFSSCNSANPDAQNTASAFNNIVDANEITGWDGGTVYNYDDREEVKGGEGSPKDYKYKFTDQGLLIYPTSYDGQPTWWKYVPKDSNESPIRERQGKVRIK